jgi:hypothetical protein
MSAEQEFIKFRLKQFIRILKSIGWINLLIVTPMGLIFILSVIESLQNQINPYITLICYVLLVPLVHGYRKDDKFLKKIKVSRFRLYTIEYFLMCLPLSFIFYILGYWWVVVMGNIAIILLSALFLKYNLELSSSSKNWRLTFFPDTLFEWKSSIRLFNYKLISLWLLGAITAIYVYAYFIFVFLFITIISSTFKPTEGKELRPYDVHELISKVKQNNFMLILCLIPHVIIFLALNISYWYIILGIALYLILYQTYCIFYKYGTYTQYTDSSNQVATAIFMILCPIIPISIPIIIFSFFKARNRIQNA